MSRDQELLDLTSDYLLSSFGQTTATGMSALLEGDVSHDQIQRWLASSKKDSSHLWKWAKPLVRSMESDDGVLVVDDSVEEKPYTDENELICWHYDPSKERMGKGINFVSLLYGNSNLSVSVDVRLVTKTIRKKDKKTGKEKRVSSESKNHQYRQMLLGAQAKQLRYGYVVNDIWYSSAATMVFVKKTLKKEFVMPIKSNRKVALFAGQDKGRCRYQRVDTLSLEPGAVCDVWLEGVSFPVRLTNVVFENKDGSTGTLYLVTSDRNLTAERMKAIYQTRWKIEVYHKSLKQNAALARSPTQTVTTQTNHFFASLYAYLKLEKLKLRTKVNHFALKGKLYLRAVQQAFEELRRIQASSVPIPAA
jgi:IS4 transposase